MRAILSLVALIGGIWLVYLGYERQQSLAGKADNTLSKIGQKMDGGDHTPTHMKYFVAGAVLVLGGVVGLGLVKR
jgi:threonine/homoserine/homoserine lactone efflux protein